MRLLIVKRWSMEPLSNARSGRMATT
jgi:hypothetical protein